MMLCIVSANVSALFGLFGIYLLKNKCIYSHGCKKPTGRTGSYYGHKDECEKDEQGSSELADDYPGPLYDGIFPG